jgi:hypothetical protein
VRKFIKNYYSLLLIGFFTLAMNSSVFAQNEVIGNAKAALKAGNSKELIKCFNDMLELRLEGEKSNYSKTQAEFVMKDFFKKYPPVDFQYIHQGASPEGIKYAIGKYTYSDGEFRVYMLIKQFKGSYLIETLDFSQD